MSTYGDDDDDSEMDLFTCVKAEREPVQIRSHAREAGRQGKQIKRVKLDSKLAMALDTTVSDNEMSKANKTRREFWTGMNYSIKHHVPITAHTADLARVFEMSVLRVEYTSTDTKFTVRMPADVAAELINVYAQHACVTFERVGEYTNLFAIHMANTTDIIMHVLSQGSRDRPGTVKGHTNCWAVKMNSSKFNRKPMGKTLIVPLPHPADRILPFFRRAALVTAAVASRCMLRATVCDVSTGHVMENRTVTLDGYDATNALFAVNFIDAGGPNGLAFVPTLVSRAYTDAVLLNSDAPHAVVFQSDGALVEREVVDAIDVADHVRFRAVMTRIDDSAAKIMVEIVIVLPDSGTLDHEAAKKLGRLTETIPTIEPYNPLKMKQKTPITK